MVRDRIAVTFIEGGYWFFPEKQLSTLEIKQALQTGILRGNKIAAIRRGNILYDFVLAKLGYNPWYVVPPIIREN